MHACNEMKWIPINENTWKSSLPSQSSAPPATITTAPQHQSSSTTDPQHHSPPAPQFPLPQSSSTTVPYHQSPPKKKSQAPVLSITIPAPSPPQHHRPKHQSLSPQYPSTSRPAPQPQPYSFPTAACPLNTQWIEAQHKANIKKLTHARKQAFIFLSCHIRYLYAQEHEPKVLYASSMFMHIHTYKQTGR